MPIALNGYCSNCTQVHAFKINVPLNCTHAYTNICTHSGQCANPNHLDSANIKCNILHVSPNHEINYTLTDTFRTSRQVSLSFYKLLEGEIFPRSEKEFPVAINWPEHSYCIRANKYTSCNFTFPGS